MGLHPAAPSFSAIWSLCWEPAVTRGIAPAIQVSWMAAVSTSLAPAWISTESPGWTIPVTESTGTTFFTLQLLHFLHIGLFYHDHLTLGPPNVKSLVVLREHIDFLSYCLWWKWETTFGNRVISSHIHNLCFTYEIIPKHISDLHLSE